MKSSSSVPHVTIIDLEVQNILSVENAFRLIGAEVSVVKEPSGLADAQFLVLPGVGAYGAAAARLQETGLRAAILQHAKVKRLPTMGLCLGMQLLADSSDEYGNHAGLGLIAGRVTRLVDAPPDYRVPSIGWREVSLCGPSPVPQALSGRSFYHVHSYHFETANPAHTVGVSRFGAGEISSIVFDANVLGTQFHPEKSQDAGLDLLHAALQFLR